MGIKTHVIISDEISGFSTKFWNFIAQQNIDEYGDPLELLCKAEDHDEIAVDLIQRNWLPAMS